MAKKKKAKKTFKVTLTEAEYNNSLAYEYHRGFQQGKKHLAKELCRLIGAEMLEIDG